MTQPNTSQNNSNANIEKFLIETDNDNMEGASESEVQQLGDLAQNEPGDSDEEDQESELQDEEQEEVKPLEKGAAIEKMRTLAQEIYNSTPKISDCKYYFYLILIDLGRLSKISIKDLIKYKERRWNRR